MDNDRNNIIKRVIYAFLVGTIFAMLLAYVIYNFIIKNELISIDITGVTRIKEKSTISSYAYEKIIYIRVLVLSILLIAHFTKFKKYIHFLLFAIYGFRISFVITIFICALKIKGLLCGILCYMPHEYLYMLADVITINALPIFKYNKYIIEKRKLLFGSILILCIDFIGIISELHVNPWIFKIIY